MIPVMESELKLIKAGERWGTSLPFSVGVGFMFLCIEQLIFSIVNSFTMEKIYIMATLGIAGIVLLLVYYFNNKDKKSHIDEILKRSKTVD